MASPAVVNTNTTSIVTPATTGAINYPASLVADNLALAWIGVNVRDADTLIFPAGWNVILDDVQLSATHRTVLAWKKLLGSEGATFTVTNGSLPTVTRYAALTYQISGAIDPASQVPEFATMAVGSSTSMNAGLVTPTGGSKDYLFIILGASTLGASSTTVPTNYGGRIAVGNALDENLHGCTRQATVASEDPAAWTMSPTTPWVTTVVAVHPPAAAVVGAPRRIWGGEFFRSSV